MGLCRPLGAGLGVARVDRVGRVDQPVERLLGLRPLAVHAEHHDLLVRRRHVDQVADPLHVRLAGEHPEVADEDRADGRVEDHASPVSTRTLIV